jgi:hypothetical protein
VTGPREWPSRYLVFFELNKLAIKHEMATGDKQAKLTVVHGNDSGADHFADQWASWRGLPERHDVLWRVNGKLDILAGFKRNQEMIDSGADICLAFLMQCTKRRCKRTSFHYTHGTWDCVTRARKAGIPVLECYYRSQ